MWESEQHLTCVWPRAASRHGQCTHTSADGMDALQTHLVQLVHCLEPCSLVALVGTSAHDGGRRIDRHCAGRVHGRGALDVHVLGGEEQGAEEDRRQLHCVPAHGQGKGSISVRKPWRMGHEGLVPAQDGPRVRDGSAGACAGACVEESGAAAAAARLCAAEEVHGMLGRAWVGSGSADASEEAPALRERACTKTKPGIGVRLQALFAEKVVTIYRNETRY